MLQYETQERHKFKLGEEDFAKPIVSVFTMYPSRIWYRKTAAIQLKLDIL